MNSTFGKPPNKQLANRASKGSRKTEPVRHDRDNDMDVAGKSSGTTGRLDENASSGQRGGPTSPSIHRDRDGVHSSQGGPSRSTDVSHAPSHAPLVAPLRDHARITAPSNPRDVPAGPSRTAPRNITGRRQQRKMPSRFNQLQDVYVPKTKSPPKVIPPPKPPKFVGKQKAAGRVSAKRVSSAVDTPRRSEKSAMKSELRMVARKSNKASRLDDSGDELSAQWSDRERDSDESSSDDSVDPVPSRLSRRKTSSKPWFAPPRHLKIDDDMALPPRLVQAIMSSRYPGTRPKVRLPFLARNFKKGFINRCIEEDGSEDHNTADPPFVTFVAWRLAGTDFIHRAKWDNSLCPLCPLRMHGYFRCRRTLRRHLEWDHSDVDVKWHTMSTGGTHLEVMLPASATTKETKGIPLYNFISVSRYIVPSRDPNTASLLDSAAHATKALAPSVGTLNIGMQGLKVEDDEGLLPPEEVAARAIAEEEEAERSNARKLRDPKFGPTAKYPYLPAESQYGGPSVPYSTRPGGPKVYDLLGTLPMRSFGVLAWEITVKEEQIFDLPKMSDSHKVMHALWNRWIFFNRSQFLKDHLQGMISFVDQYWRMIRLAAGWNTLRWWLLIWITAKYLKGNEMFDVYTRYEKLCEEEYVKENEVPAVPEESVHS